MKPVSLPGAGADEADELGGCQLGAGADEAGKPGAGADRAIKSGADAAELSLGQVPVKLVGPG